MARRITIYASILASGCAGVASYAIPPAPPPPAVQARIDAECRTAPATSISLVSSTELIPDAPAELNLGWAIKLTPPDGAQIGRVIGVTRTWSGSIVAATDRGYWIRVPSADDESRIVPDGPVAVSIRELPGVPTEMAYASLTGEPGYTGPSVFLAVEGAPSLLTYQIGGCFPGALPAEGPALPPGNRIVGLEPAIDRTARIIYRTAQGQLRSTSSRPETADLFEADAAVSDTVAAATASARVAIASGCDQVTFHRQDSRTLVRSSCSPGYLGALDELWEKPYRQHRQPAATSQVRDIGWIDAPIVAVSNAQLLGFGKAGAVPRGDLSDPGQPCSFVLAAQAGPDAPIFFYGMQPYCAYYPRDPSGAPFPPPPPP